MDLTTIFVITDDFCKFYQQKLLKESGDITINPGNSKMTMSEIIAIVIDAARQSEVYKTFKAYYKKEYSELKSAFPDLVSYTRLVELRQEVIQPLSCLLKSILAACDGETYQDSTPIPACHIKRENSHRVLKQLAKKGKSTNGWFYGTKLHLALNKNSLIVNLLVTPGNVADNNHDLLRRFARKLWGTLVGDRGYMVNDTLRDELYQCGLRILHGLRSNMPNKLLPAEDKMRLRRRANISEGANSKIKDRMSLVHTKIRSLAGFFSHTLSILIAYQLWAYERLFLSSQKTIIPA